MFSQANENVSYWYSNCLFIPYLGHCAKLQAIINKSATDPRAADKLWLVVIDDDTIMRWFSMELSTVLDKTDEKFRTIPLQIEDGKMVRLGFRAASSLISGEGVYSSILFCPRLT